MTWLALLIPHADAPAYRRAGWTVTLLLDAEGGLSHHGRYRMLAVKRAR